MFYSETAKLNLVPLPHVVSSGDCLRLSWILEIALISQIVMEYVMDYVMNWCVIILLMGGWGEFSELLEGHFF